MISPLLSPAIRYLAQAKQLGLKQKADEERALNEPLPPLTFGATDGAGFLPGPTPGPTREEKSARTRETAFTGAMTAVGQALGGAAFAPAIGRALGPELARRSVLPVPAPTPEEIAAAMNAVGQVVGGPGLAPMVGNALARSVGPEIVAATRPPMRPLWTEADQGMLVPGSAPPSAGWGPTLPRRGAAPPSKRGLDFDYLHPHPAPTLGLGYPGLVPIRSDDEAALADNESRQRENDDEAGRPPDHTGSRAKRKEQQGFVDAVTKIPLMPRPKGNVAEALVTILGAMYGQGAEIGSAAWHSAQVRAQRDGEDLMTKYQNDEAKRLAGIQSTGMEADEMEADEDQADWTHRKALQEKRASLQTEQGAITKRIDREHGRQAAFDGWKSMWPDFTRWGLTPKAIRENLDRYVAGLPPELEMTAADFLGAGAGAGAARAANAADRMDDASLGTLGGHFAQGMNVVEFAQLVRISQMERQGFATEEQMRRKAQILTRLGLSGADQRNERLMDAIYGAANRRFDGVPVPASVPPPRAPAQGGSARGGPAKGVSVQKAPPGPSRSAAGGTARPKAGSPAPLTARGGSRAPIGRGLVRGGRVVVDAAPHARADALNGGLAGDLADVAAGAGVRLTVGTANTGHSALTASRNPSRHKVGDAVDVVAIDGIPIGDPRAAPLWHRIRGGLAARGYAWNPAGESGLDAVVLGPGWAGGGHEDHLHISRRSGGGAAPPQPHRTAFAPARQGSRSSKRRTRSGNTYQ